MFCQTCDKHNTCNKICKELNKYLRDNGIYSADYIRPEVSSQTRRSERKKGIYMSKYREIPFSSLKNRNKDGDFTKF